MMASVLLYNTLLFIYYLHNEIDGQILAKEIQSLWWAQSSRHSQVYGRSFLSLLIQGFYVLLQIEIGVEV